MLPEEFDCQIQSWDLTLKDRANSDYVVGQVWAAKGADRFLLHQRRERMDLPQTKAAMGVSGVPSPPSRRNGSSELRRFSACVITGRGPRHRYRGSVIAGAGGLVDYRVPWTSEDHTRQWPRNVDPNHCPLIVGPVRASPLRRKWCDRRFHLDPNRSAPR